MGDADCSAVFGPGGGTVCAQVHAVREFSRFGTLLPLLSSHCYYTPVALGSLCLPECGMDSICLSCAVPYVKCHVYVLKVQIFRLRVGYIEMYISYDTGKAFKPPN